MEAAAGRASDSTNAVPAAWDLEAARTRAAARVRLHIGEAPDAAWHPAVKSAHAFLIGDTPAQAAADLDTLRRWYASHPEALDPDDGTLMRITARLAEMAQRMPAGKGVT